MDPLTTSALISGGAGLLSGILGSSSQSRENKLAYERQLQLQKQQQDYNTMMWNMTNNYNSPGHQIDLYKSAGINPNTAVSAISGVAANNASTPSVPSPAYTGSSSSLLMQGIGSIADYLLKAKQASNLDAQTERQHIENKLLEKDLGVRDELNNLTLEQYRANISKSAADTDLSRKKIDELSYQLSEILPEIKKKTIAEREKISQDMKLSVQELANAIRQGNFLSERIETEKVSRSQIYFQIEGQRFRNQVDQLHARFANEFGIDISSDKWQLLVEAALAGGDNADAIINALTETSSHVVTRTARSVATETKGIADDLFSVPGLNSFIENMRGHPTPGSVYQLPRNSFWSIFNPTLKRRK